MTEKQMRDRAAVMAVKYRNYGDDALASAYVSAGEKYRRAVICGDGSGESGLIITSRYIEKEALGIELERRDREADGKIIAEFRR